MTQQVQQLSLIGQHVSQCSLTHHVESIQELQNLKEQPKPKEEVKVEIKTLKNNIYQVIVKANIILASGINKIFSINLDMVGEFQVTGFDKDMLDKILNIQCPTMLTPFLNERLTSLLHFTVIARPPMPNINFEEIYVNKLSAA